MSFVLDPRLEADSFALGDFALSRIRLMNDARYFWVILVPQRAGLRDMGDLLPGDRLRLMEEIVRCENAVAAIDRADKMNVAWLGNQVPQLHIHVIARHTGDAAWPRPIWGVGTPERYAPDTLEARVRRLREALCL